MNGPIDAKRFLARGASLLDAVVLIRRDGGNFEGLMNGIRVTSELVFTLDTADGARFTIGDVPVQRAWSGKKLVVLRTPRYAGSLPELSMMPYTGEISMVFVDAATRELQIALGRTLDGHTHDAPSILGSRGAPIFDSAWSVVGLHDARFNQGDLRELESMPVLMRELEASPCWDEVAAVHRLVRTAATHTQVAARSITDGLARAVRWTPDDDAPMTERERRRAVAGATLSQLRSARGSDAAASAEQRAIDRILIGPPYALDAIESDVLLPFATAVRWFRGVVPELPDDAALEQAIRHRRQLDGLRAIVGPHFAPRTEEVRHLEEWLGDPARRAMVLRGPGGIGKSALLAHFMLDHLDALRFAWLDFDRPDISVDEASIMRVVDEYLAWQPGDKPLVVVLDSFETSVQTYGYTQLNPALDALAQRFADFGVIVGSRTAVPLLRVEGELAEEYELAGLDHAVATKWLVEDGVPDAIASEIAKVTHGVPLNLRLARDLVKGKSEAETHELLATLPKQLVTGYLYRRILRRLSDETLKDQAQWAMVPRRLVPELLAKVLAVSDTEAKRLFEALRKELTLLEGESVLTVRPDLRNTLLPLLAADDKARVRAIDAVAADFWAERAKDDSAAAGEAIYHCLRIGDLTRANTLWRPAAAPYLRGYTIDEIPPTSQSWLESRVAHQSVTERVEDLLARGQLTAARQAFADQPRGVGTLSATTKRRRLLGMAASAGLDVPGHPDLDGLEAIVLPSYRPAPIVEKGRLPTFEPPWDHLATHRARLESAIAAVGRVQLGADDAILGTATRVGARLFLTTRTAIEPFAVGAGRDVNLVVEKKPSVVLQAESQATRDVHAIVRIVLVHPYWDIAIVEVADVAPPPVLALEAEDPVPNRDVVVIGHPVNDAGDELVERVFGGVAGIKRAMPGKYRGLESELSFGRSVMAGRDDASTLGRDVGAAVIDPETGRLLGVRFVTVYLSHASFVPMCELARDPEIQKSGVRIAGTPGSPRDWVSAWTASPPPQVLIDAYLAWRSGDFERAKAVLAIAPRSPDSPADPRRRYRSRAQIDRTLLEAALLVASDPEQAAEILEDLVAHVPSESWSSADRDAVIATRLRLAVDADAELAFLQLLRDKPTYAGLIVPDRFRVLVPPRRELPWGAELRGDFGDVQYWSNLSEKGFSPEAVTAARRVVVASDRCIALRSWIQQHAMPLADLGYVLGATSGAVVRELVASHVAFPPEIVRPVSRFLLEKTDLAPHPTKGWGPILEPLAMLFRDARGFLPQGVMDTASLAPWLAENARSSRLGAYLAKELAIDTPVAWAAGLLHLSTPLPIEALLQRRFTAEKAS